MRLVGFDAGVARAHGYEIVTLPDGSQASVPADKADAARAGTYVPKTGVLKAGSNNGGREATPHGYAQLAGDCGISYVALYTSGYNGSARLLTGGDTAGSGAGSPWSVNWNVNIVDDRGSSNQHYDTGDGSIAGTRWASYWRVLHLKPQGWAAATVVWYSSWMITTGGWFCWSEGPSTAEFID
jgi:hypothetical protein